MVRSRTILALDVGEKRIGVALADTTVCIAIAYDTIEVDGNELQRIAEIVELEAVTTIVVGYPRNQGGETTEQTRYSELFAKNLEVLDVEIKFQDESLTSVKAEELLKARKKPYEKGDIDALAASLTLQDYLEAHHGRV